MSDIKIYGGAAVPAAMYSKGDFVLNSGVNATKAGLFEFKDIPMGVSLYSFGALFALDQRSYGQFLETTGDDYSKAMYRVHHGWDRCYSAHTGFSYGEKITITHDPDPHYRRTARAFYVVPPTVTLTAPSITGDANTLQAVAGGVMKILPQPDVRIIHTIECGVENAAYVNVMNDTKGYIAKTYTYTLQDMFMVVASSRLFYFQRVDDEWVFQQTLNSPVGLGPWCSMNHDYFVSISGGSIVKFKNTDNVWAWESTTYTGGTIQQICMNTNDVVLGGPINILRYLRKKGSGDPAEYNARFVEQINLETDVVSYMEGSGYFYQYPEYSRSEGQINSIEHNGETFGLYHMLDGGNFSYATETCVLFKLYNYGGATVFVGPNAQSVFGGSKTESEWDWHQFNFDNMDYMFLCDTDVYDEACGGGYWIHDYSYNTLVVGEGYTRDDFMAPRTDGAEPTIFTTSFYGTLWDRNVNGLLMSVVGSTFRWEKTTKSGVSWDPKLSSGGMYRRLDLGDELFFVNSTNSSGEVYLAKPVFENFLANSPAVATFKFTSQSAIVSINEMTATVTNPVGTLITVTLSEDNITFYKWGGTSWDVSSGPSDGADFATTAIELLTSPFVVSAEPNVYVRVELTTTTEEDSPSLVNLQLIVGTVSTSRSKLADTSEVLITMESATETTFTSKFGSIVLCEAQVSLIAPKHTVGLDDHVK
jgi:hypothetical protein